MCICLLQGTWWPLPGNTRSSDACCTDLVGFIMFQWLHSSKCVGCWLANQNASYVCIHAWRVPCRFSDDITTCCSVLASPSETDHLDNVTLNLRKCLVSIPNSCVPNVRSNEAAWFVPWRPGVRLRSISARVYAQAERTEGSWARIVDVFVVLWLAWSFESSVYVRVLLILLFAKQSSWRGCGVSVHSVFYRRKLRFKAWQTGEWKA